MRRRGDLEAAFGRVVRERRLRAGFSQEALAEAAGLHRNYVGLVERGANSPSLAAIAALADALELAVSDLLGEAEREAASRVADKGRRSG